MKPDSCSSGSAPSEQGSQLMRGESVPRDGGSAIRERPPLYWEAVAYCRERHIPDEDVERARRMLVWQEYMRRTEPHTQQMARIMALQPGKWIVGEGYVRADISHEASEALKSTQALIDAEAVRLGLLPPPASSPDTPT